MSLHSTRLTRFRPRWLVQAGVEAVAEAEAAVVVAGAEQPRPMHPAPAW